MRERRQFYRRLLSRLLRERSDSDGLYIPRGEDGMRRMIRALLDMRAPRESDPLKDDIAWFKNAQRPGQEE